MAELSRRNFVIGAAGGAGLLGLGLAGGASAPAARAEEAIAYVPGTYTASAPGHNGDVTVAVTFSEDAIEQVEVVSQKETASIAASPLAYIPRTIVDGQSLNIDGFSGATFTSRAIVEAAADCVKQAGADPDALREAPKAPESTELVAGTYTASSHGHHSDVEIEVQLAADGIESINVTGCGETFNLADLAVTDLPERIVAAQSTGVDVVTGATYTSRALMTALESCIDQAGGIEAVRAFSARRPSEPWSTEEHELDADVVVVGSGMSGIAAALSAQEAGANVVIVEKMPFYGGVSQACKGYFRTPYDDSPESIESYYQYGLHMHCGVMQGETQDAFYPDEALMRTFADNCYQNVKWLETMGAELEWLPMAHIQHMPEYFLGGAHFLAEDHPEAPDVTGVNFRRMLGGFVDRGGTILLETPVQELIVENGAVTGVKAAGRNGSYTVNARAVVLCAGGFGANPALVREWAPAYQGEENVTLVGNVGDGIELGLSAGGAIWDSALMMGQFGHSMVTDYDMVHPYEDDETPSTAIFVNPQGLRVNSETPVAYSGGTSYVNPETTHRDYYWAITNAGILADQPDYQQMLDEQLAAGNERFYKADTLADLAKALCITPNTLRYTLNRYNRLCDAGQDTDFFKDPSLLQRFEDEGPWYGVKCELVYFGTVGGLKIDTSCAVLDADGNPVPGLFAAGENANGGLFNLSYVGGRSMPVCATMGRIAGTSAAQA